MPARRARPDPSSAPKRAPAARRRPGRPSADAGADPRSALLDAAVATYARHGIAHARLRDIAAYAGVTPALVHYYFGDREALVQAVIEERVMPAIAGVRELLAAAGDDLCATIACFIRGIHGVVARHPWLPALWVREILNEDGALRDVLLRRIAPQVPQLLAQRFAAAQQAGRLNRDLDPRLLVVSLVGLTLFPLAAAPIWRTLFDAGDVSGDDLAAHAFALLDRGLEADHAP